MASSKNRITIADISRETGFSRATVSYALRNDPNTSRETRKHIQETAKRLGYRPDPVISKLMLRLNGDRKQTAGSMIAFLNAGDRPDFIANTPTLHEFFRSARERAQTHGYNCDEFWLHEPGRSGRRLANILESRGIQGILLGSTGRPNTTLDFPWERFATVTVGYSVANPRLHRVVTHHYENALLALGKAREAGYRRIGFFADPQMEPTMHNLHLAAILTEQYESATKEIVTPCFGPDKLAHWYVHEKPDIVLNGTVLTRGEMQTLGLPNDVPTLSLVPSENHPSGAGINVGYDKLGEIAMNLLADNLLHDQLGIPHDSQTIMINGTWYDTGVIEKDQG